MLIINETCFAFLFAHIAGYAVMGHACLVISFSLLTYFIASCLPGYPGIDHDAGRLKRLFGPKPRPLRGSLEHWQ
jgi:hypothetical protein